MSFNPIPTFETAFPDTRNVQLSRPPDFGVPDWLRDELEKVRRQDSEWPVPETSDPSFEDDISVGEIAGELEKIAADHELGPDKRGDGTNGTQIMDVIALYAPYSFWGPFRWGIWWNEPAMLRATAQLALDAHRHSPSISFAMVAHTLRRTIRQHEVFHFAVEYTAAHIGRQHRQDFYRPSAGRSARGHHEEILATAYEMKFLQTRRASTKLPPGVLSAVKTAWLATPLAGPYALWREASDESGWAHHVEQHAHALSMPGDAGHLYSDLARLAPATATPSVLPEYRVGLNRILIGPHGHLWARVSRPSVEQVIRHARRAARLGIPSGVRVEQRSKHPLAIVREGKLRPVTVDPVKWDRVDHPVVGQLAELFDLTRIDYLREVAES